jgi:glycosyltransferase involved in cell wall biosynthesis
MSTSKSLRVQLLTDTGAWGGAEIHAVKLAKTLAGRGHEVRVIGLNQDLFREPCLRAGRGIEYQYVQLPKPVRQMSYRGWKSLFRALPPDVCILVKNWFAAGSFALDLAARHSFRSYLTIEQLAGEPIGPKFSRRYLGGLLPGLGLWWYRQRIGCYLRSLGPQRVVCVSDAVRDRLVRDYHFPARKAVTIHNGIDPERFQPSRDFGSASRKAWGIPEDALVFGAVGRLVNSHKGYDVAVELFSELKQMLPSRDIRLVLAGAGPDEQVLKNLACRLGVANLVCYPGFANRPWEVYPGIDVFLMPSLNEGLPHALAEAMACGCCPIAMGVGGIPELVSDPGLGWLVAPGDRQGFHTAMAAAACCSPEARLQIGSRARDYVIDHFNEKRLLGALVDLIEASYLAK